MTTTSNSQVAGSVAAPKELVWQRTAQLPALLCRTGFTVERSRGAADEVSFATDQARVWHGLLRLLDEDEVDYQRTYSLSAASLGERLSASIVTHLSTDSTGATSISVGCDIISTAREGVFPEHLTSAWLTAIETAADSWGEETWAAPGPRLRQLDPDHASGLRSTWTKAGVAFVAGIAVGACTRLCPRPSRRHP